MQGWLEKKNGLLENDWTDCYFVLGSSSVNGIHLAYYTDESLTEQRRKYSINKKCDAFITTDDAGVKNFTFDIRTPGHSELQLNAPNEQNRNEWLHAISKFCATTVMTTLDADKISEVKSHDVKAYENVSSRAINDIAVADKETISEYGKKIKVLQRCR